MFIFEGSFFLGVFMRLELGVFILIIAGELRGRHFWKKIRGNTIFQAHSAVRSLGTMQWSIMQLDLSWKCVRRLCKVQAMCKGKFGLVFEMSSEQWV